MIPDIIYKFRDLKDESHKKLIYEQQLWFSVPDKLNDPFDCRICFRYDLLELKALIDITSYLAQPSGMSKREVRAEAKQWHLKLSENPQLELENFAKSFRESPKHALCSFCKSPMHALNWSHYARGHHGICIGYNRNEIENRLLDAFSVTRQATRCIEVEYVNEIPLMIPSRNNFDSLSDRRYSLKPAWWAHEEEVRFIIHLSLGLNKFGTSLNLPREAVREIYLGCEMNQRDEKDACKKLSEIYPNVAIHKMSVEFEGVFGLRKDRIV